MLIRCKKTPFPIPATTLENAWEHVVRRGYTKLAKKLIDFPDKGGYLAYVLYPISWLLSLFGQTGRMTLWARKVQTE